MAAKRKPPKGKPFQPGQSGNPSGRKKVPDDVKAAFEGATMASFQKLKELRDTGSTEDIQFRAAVAILDRALGRPAQAVTLDPSAGLMVSVTINGVTPDV